MKLVNLVGERFKERPADCVFDSHALMVKGGYIKYVGNGIYSLFPPMKRITQKIEKILREEMDSLGAQEVMLPVALPAKSWEESGRYETVGAELLRFKDRNGADMLLGMTHEESATQLVREYANTYAKYPLVIYQIQTKFRDEKRPRAGLIRVREFTMKDAYSFHTSYEDLEKWYDKFLHAYNRIFARAGIPETICVRGDSGMMGGSISHEYMLLTPMGEDSLATCSSCDYKSNVEAAECILPTPDDIGIEAPLEKVHTPNIHTMEELAECIGVPTNMGAKAVVYEYEQDSIINVDGKEKQVKKGDLVIAFIRGDLEVNETKLTNAAGATIIPAELNENSPVIPGFIGPIGLDGKEGIATIIYDKSLEPFNALTCGANEADYHYKNLNIKRDIGDVTYSDIATIEENMICPKCGKPTINISRGIEVGNIFQLGTKYSVPMKLEYTDETGARKPAIMGSYGIGVGRLAAAVCEAKHDEYGPIWPITIAPWQVHICLLRADDVECKKIADDIYQTLQDKNIEVIYDDREDVRPGEMFSDADLLGVPIRVVVSPRNLKENKIEITTRDKSVKEMVDVDSAIDFVSDLKDKLFKEIEDKLQNA